MRQIALNTTAGTLVAGLETLAEARKARDKAHKEAGETRDQILARLRDLDDDRPRALVPAMGKRDWGLDAVEASLRHLQARPSRATSGPPAARQSASPDGRRHHQLRLQSNVALSRACHQHPYELAPAVSEVAGWIAAARKF